MAEAWGFAEDELPSLGQIVGLLPGLTIEKAEVRRLEGVFSSDDPRGPHGSWPNVAFVRARKL